MIAADYSYRANLSDLGDSSDFGKPVTSKTWRGLLEEDAGASLHASAFPLESCWVLLSSSFFKKIFQSCLSLKSRRSIIFAVRLNENTEVLQDPQ